MFNLVVIIIDKNNIIDSRIVGKWCSCVVILKIIIVFIL